MKTENMLRIRNSTSPYSTSSAVARTAVIIVLIVIIAVASGAVYSISTLSTTTTSNITATSKRSSSGTSMSSTTKFSSSQTTSVTHTTTEYSVTTSSNSSRSSSSNTKSTTSSTLAVSNNGTIAIGRPIFTPLAYDPDNGYVYSSTQDGLVAINTTTNSIVDNVSLGFTPFFIGYNPSNRLIYAGDPSTLQTATFNPFTGNITKLGFDSTTYSTPTPTAYNPSLNVYYSSGYDGFFVVNASSNQLQEFVKMGKDITSIAYDGANGLIYMADLATGSIYVVKASSNTLVANISVGAKSSPTAIALDSSNGYIYVTQTRNLYLNMSGEISVLTNVTIIDTRTNAIVKTIPDVGVLGANLIYVKQVNRVYFLTMLAGSSGARVLGIDDKTNTIVFNTTISNPAINTPTSLIYDPQNNRLYVTGNPIPSSEAYVVSIPATS